MGDNTMDLPAMAKEFCDDWDLGISEQHDLLQRLDMLAKEARNSGLNGVHRRVLNELKYTTDGKVGVEWLVSIIELWKM
jgi:hypothetical protein